MRIVAVLTWVVGLGMGPELMEGKVPELPVGRAYSLLRQLWLEDTAVLRDLKNVGIKIKAFNFFGLNLYVYE